MEAVCVAWLCLTRPGLCSASRSRCCCRVQGAQDSRHAAAAVRRPGGVRTAQQHLGSGWRVWARPIGACCKFLWKGASHATPHALNVLIGMVCSLACYAPLHLHYQGSTLVDDASACI